MENPIKGVGRMKLTEQNSAGYYLTDDFSRRISICKVWFTVMVLFIHSYTEAVLIKSGTVILQVPKWLEATKYLISVSISKCAVPGFFLISAILLFRKDFSEEGHHPAGALSGDEHLLGGILLRISATSGGQ